MLLVPFFRGLARHLHLACLAVTATATAVFAQTNSPSAADGFDPNIDGSVFAVLTQDVDGKIIVVGQFGNVQPNGGDKVARNNIARFKADGSLDTAFDPNANGAVRAAVLQQDGKLVIAGDFTTVGGSAHNYIARLNQDGSVDESFTASIGKSLNPAVALPTTPQVLALVLQKSDGAVVVGGTFGSASSAGVAAVQRNNLARFTAAGALDTTYDPNPNAVVLALAMHTNDAVIVGGGFTSLKPAGSTAATTRSHVARVQKDGSVDPVFDPATDNGVSAIAVTRDNKILLGGYFISLRPNSADNSIGRNHIARVNADGTLDTSFTTTVGGNVQAITVASDGGILVGGHFTQLYSGNNVLSGHGSIARLGLDGTSDETFTANVNGDVNTIAVQTDGKIVIGGLFSRAISSGTSTQVVRNHVARLLPSGALDTAFQFESSGRVLTSITQTDGKLVVGGSFITIGGLTRSFIARLNSDGTVDPAYNPDANGAIYAMAYDKSSNKVIVGGAFTAIGPVGSEVARNHIARLNADGSVDADFNPNINGIIGTILLQSDGSMYVAGSFTTAQPTGVDTAVSRLNILKLTSSGQVDTTFNPQASASITGMVVQPDGKLIVVGSFTYFQPNATGNAVYRNYIARLNADGTVDNGYVPQANGQVNAIVLGSDGKVTIAGQFTQILPHAAATAVIRNHIARLNADGTIDTTFDPNTDNTILTLAKQSDGKILVGGFFTDFEPNGATTPTTARYVARLNTDGTLDSSFHLDLNELTGNKVDYITVLDSGDILVGGSFISAADASGTRFVRLHLAKVKASGTLDTTFDPHPTGSSNTVKAIALQGDGKILVGGAFSDMGAAAGPNIARFNPEGTPDTVFNAALSADGTVNAIAARPISTTTSTQLNGFAWLNPDGTLRQSFAPTVKIKGHVNASLVLPNNQGIILAGVFTDDSGVTNGNIIKLKPTGEIDPTYTPNVNGVYGMLLVPSTNQVIIYGNFATVNGTTLNYLARLNADGTLDSTFNPNPSAAVNAAVLQSDGSIVFGGLFTTVTPNADTTAAVSRNYIARVDSTGKVDTNFNPNLNGAIYTLALQGDGKILAGGAFTTAQPGTDTTATTRNHIARFMTTGVLDTSFDPNADNLVYNIAVQPDDQKILVSGSFATIAGGSHVSLVRLNADGTADSSFTATTNGTVNSLALSPDKSIVIGGFFTAVTESGSSTPVARSRFARLTADGKLITAFNPSLLGEIASASVAPDNSVLASGTFINEYSSATIVVGGAFNKIGGLTQPYLAELNADGSVTAQFQPNPDAEVRSVLTLPDGRFIAAGAFTKMGSAARPGIARFNADSTLDINFVPNVTGPVNAVALQSDGKLLVGVTGGSGLVRLGTDGLIDGTFSAGMAFTKIAGIAVQADGKLIVAGTDAGNTARVARLNSDGSVDNSFSSAATGSGGSIETITLQTDGSVIVAGTFSSIGGTTISNVARLTSSGAVDTTYNPNVNGTVSAVALAEDGRLIIGGTFTAIGGLPRYSLARLGSTSPAPQKLAVSSDGKTVTWLRSGTSGEIVAVTFEYSTDALTWTSLGTGKRVASSGTWTTWQATNLSLPTDRNLFVRAHGIVPTSAGKSTGVYDAVLFTNLSVSLSSAATTVAPVASSTAWDGSHYVWTVDGSGVLRIADAYSSVTFDSTNTVLIEGGSVGGGTTSAPTARLADLSTRGIVNAASPLISGFSISGSASRQVLIRAAGPGLVPFGVSNYLKVPRLVLYNNAGAVIATNTGWDASLSADFVRVGAFPYTPGSTDAAFLVTLAPGNYTVQVTDAGTGNGGDTLIEIYDAGSLNDHSARLLNLSTRGTVAPGAALIGGLVVSGTTPKTLLVRGVGPSLAHYNVPNVLADPTITVYDRNGAVIATNDNWGMSSTLPIPAAEYAAAVSSAATQMGAFPLDPGSTDAALVITLPAGSYTVQIAGAQGTSGAGMIEVYELP